MIIKCLETENSDDVFTNMRILNTAKCDIDLGAFSVQLFFGGFY
jgi:hypothetical protein